MQREVLAVFGDGAGAEDSALVRGDRQVVDGGFAAVHETVGFEFPEFVAVAAPPLVGVVVPFVLEADRDAVAAESPETFA